MASSGQRKNYNPGYRSWFRPYEFNQRVTTSLFILDFEATSRREEISDSYEESDSYVNTQEKSKNVNGIQIFFIDEKHNKRRVFLRHDPYYYLLLERNLSESQINRIINRIREIGENKIIGVSKEISHDAADLTFLERRDFLKVIVDHPRSVPGLRSKTEAINGVIEWREADVLYIHRVAIDHNIRVGRWYNANITGGEIVKLEMMVEKAPPELKILAYDIETVFDQTREPNPNRDAISMISLFTGEKNYLLINDRVVETKEISNLDIVVKKKDKEHTKPWVDWCPEGSSFPDKMILDRVSVVVEIYREEKSVLERFYSIIEQFKPDVLADFFGDRFDIPFLAVRSLKYNISLERKTGFHIVFNRQLVGDTGERIDITENYSPSNIDHVTGAGIIHLDAFLFNEKYSYLPKKDLGLKPSVEKKLKIIPIGREALFAIEDSPVDAVGYAACDGYITHRYVKEIVLDFFISLGQMFPVSSSELLTRRAGSLDDLLIDAEDFKFNIVGKRRVEQNVVESFSSNILIDSFAYTGGLVEARKPGIFRSDIYHKNFVDKAALTHIKGEIRQIITVYSNETLKKHIKDEFEKNLLLNFGDIVIPYSEDHTELRKRFVKILQKKGITGTVQDNDLASFNKILDEISNIKLENLQSVISKTMSQIDELIGTSGDLQLRGVHVDVTSMYPSQIRQYKLQPSGIVPLSKCQGCQYAENDGSCYFTGEWVIKLTARRPCRHRVEGSGECDPSICTLKHESSCPKYEPEQAVKGRIREIFTFDGTRTQAYSFRKKGGLVKINFGKSYLGKDNDPESLYKRVMRWLQTTVDATQISNLLDRNHFDIFDDQPEDFQLPPNTFLSLDVRTKKITVLLSVQSRVCQKAFNFVARIMDDFFITRVEHKKEAQRLKRVIDQGNKQNTPVSAEIIRQQRFHDSTQLGMKVPLNSVYGLLGMKAGVRNASTPCAGITTKLSADLIHWAANQLEKIGVVTELDTDGVWLWIPRKFPLDFPVTISSNGKSQEIKVSIIDKILNERVDKAGFKNDNYWMNDGSQITKQSKSLIQFEQDGPYDFQFVMGKKKYIVFNYNSVEKRWEEKEITGLESKRADFSKLQKYFQEVIIQSYLEDYSPTKPITLADIYQNAIKKSDSIKKEVEQGKLDPTYFVKPKAVNKHLSEYKSKLPQVTAAYMLQDLGFSVDPGVRIQMVNIIGNHVIPSQIFDFDFETVKKVFIKHGICTLSFMLNELSTMDDIRKLIDTKQYLDDIYGPGRIFDRMIEFPMKIQHQVTQNQQRLTIEPYNDEILAEEVFNNKIPSIGEVDLPNQEKKEFIKKSSPIPVKIIQKTKSTKRKTTRSKRSKMSTQSLDTIFNIPIGTKTPTKSSSKKKQRKSKKNLSQPIDKPSSQLSNTPKADTKVESSSLKNDSQEIGAITREEVEEVEEAAVYSNGNSVKDE
jgi:DNA polymerase elongation subunit (family B)